MLTIDTILFPTDWSACAERAFEYAADLADRHGAALHVLRVTDAQPGERLAGPEVAGVQVVEVQRAGTEPAPAILGYAGAHAVDLIVMGTHGRQGMGRILAGSVAEEIVRRAEVPVLTVSAAQGSHVAWPPRRLLVPVDFSEYSEVALRHARALATMYGASLDLIHVIEDEVAAVVYGIEPVGPALGGVAARAQEALDALAARYGADAATVAVGPAAETVVTHARTHDADLVVLSTHGRTGLRHFLVGSVAEYVVGHAGCPVFVVKPFRRGLVPPADAAPRRGHASPSA